MANNDISRHATNFAKHFDGARMQQGRVLTDDDFNEHARLRAEELRRTRLDVIGPAGSPDDGFRIDSPGQSNSYNTFVIKAGSFYLGGLRLTAEVDEYYHLQRDWLQQGEDPADRIADPTTKHPRRDLVYLEAWQQPVSAVEDAELFEVALGGPDTSTRVRTMRRVRVVQDIKETDDCQSALAGIFADPGKGILSDDGELISDARLKVEPDPATAPTDLCSPGVAGGYLGAENQAIRVQLVSPTEFTWGFDNAAPLYRVHLKTDSSGKLTRIEMLTEPKDQAHWPLSGQVMELLPWSAALVNHQKTANLNGHLAKVTIDYDPHTKEFTIDQEPAASEGKPPQPFGMHWRDRNDGAGDPAKGDATELESSPDGAFFYLRVWNRGSDIASPPRIPIPAAPSAVTLGNTGLKITFSGTQFQTGDFWIVAVRPESPDVFVPWDYDPNKPGFGQPSTTVGRPPQGVRRWYTPLAIVEWTSGILTPTGKVIHDCREYFPPLTRTRTCCTYSVGDGTNSHGRFTKIQDALDQLPPEGGKICLLPGVFKESVVIENKHDITISGCGSRSTIISPGPLGKLKTATPVISIIGGNNILLESFVVQADITGLGIKVNGLLPKSGTPMAEITSIPASDEVINISLFELEVTGFVQSAVEARFVRGLSIRHCHLRNRPNSDFPNKAQTLVIRGDDILIENNIVEVAQPPRDESLSAPPAFAPSMRAEGGIQIEGMSDHVRIIDNLIRGGRSNGITLGAIVVVPSATPSPPATPSIPADPCDACGPISNFVPKPTDGSSIEDTGPLFDVRIERNRIFQMGGCGIGVAGFFAPTDFPIFIQVDQLTILGNEIRKCVQRPIASLGATQAPWVSYGGIALAAVNQLVIYDNVIESCGFTAIHPVCGIFALVVEGLDISRNRILENGGAANDLNSGESGAALTFGFRGGIVIGFALAPIVNLSSSANPISKVSEKVSLPTIRCSGASAARIHNNIVTAPIGRALHLNALGPVTVEGNHLTSRGLINSHNLSEEQRFDFSSLFAGSVWLLNLGFPLDFYLRDTNFSTLMQARTTNSANFAEISPQLFLASGQILFNDNRVRLDALKTSVGLTFASISIVSSDDVGFQDNQSEVNLASGQVFCNAQMLAHSVRVNSNRFTEGIFNAFFSALTVGFLNSTTYNQSTHCLLPFGASPITDGNTQSFGVSPLINLSASPTPCLDFQKTVLAGLAAKNLSL